MRTLNVLCITGLLAFTSCVSEQAYKNAMAEKDAAEQTLADMSQRLKQVTADRDALSKQVRGLADNAVEEASMRKSKLALEEMLKKLRERSSTNITGVTTFSGPSGEGVRVEGQVVFASGKAEVTKSGRALLSQLVPMLMETNKKLQVIGHTDTDPVKHSRNNQWSDNLGLSASRGIAVAQFLIGAGIPADKVSIAGYGQYLPIQADDSAEAKSRNRRVEIMLLD